MKSMRDRDVDVLIAYINNAISSALNTNSSQHEHNLEQGEKFLRDILTEPWDVEDP